MGYLLTPGGRLGISNLLIYVEGRDNSTKQCLENIYATLTFPLVLKLWGIQNMYNF